MEKSFFILALISAMAFSSCSNDCDIENTLTNVTGTRTLSLDVSTPVEFANETEFKSAIEQISKLDNSEKKLAWVHAHYPTLHSIMDIYYDALTEADKIGDSESDFNQFMDKYSSLYFPLYKEDAGFYVPIQDENVAYLANSKCEVKIGGQVVSLRDVFDYQTLMDMGVAYYTNTSSKRLKAVSSSDVDILRNYEKDMNSVGTEYDSDWRMYEGRKVKLKARRRVSSNVSKLHFEFCFRKKKPRGWVNYSSESTFNGKVNLATTDRKLTLAVNKKIDGRSSHDYEIECNVHLDQTTLIFLYLDCSMTVQFRGIGDINFNWGMKAVACYNYRPLPTPAYENYIRPVI